MRAKNEEGLGSTRFSHVVVFVLPTIWKPGTGSNGVIERVSGIGLLPIPHGMTLS